MRDPGARQAQARVAVAPCPRGSSASHALDGAGVAAGSWSRSSARRSGRRPRRGRPRRRDGGSPRRRSRSPRYQPAARRCSSGSSSGALRRQLVAGGARRRGGGSGTTRGGCRAAPGRGSSAPARPASAPTSAVPATASHSGPREPPEDRGAQQELAALRGLAVEHLGGEVVHHQPVVAREVGDEAPARRRGRAATGPPGRGPAAQPSVRARRAATSASARSWPIDAAEQGGGLAVVEAQVGRAQLGQVAPRPQPGEADRRLDAAGHHQAQALGQVRHHELQRPVDRRARR